MGKQWEPLCPLSQTTGTAANSPDGLLCLLNITPPPTFHLSLWRSTGLPSGRVSMLPFKLSHYRFYAGTDNRLVCIPTACRDYTRCFSSFWSDVCTGGGADLGIKEARDKDQLAKKPRGEGKRIQMVCLSFLYLEEGHTLCEPRPKLHPY